MKIRVYELQVGDMFRYMGVQYMVKSVDPSGILYIPAHTPPGRGTLVRFGRKSMQFVELIDRHI